jgi:hypothetical protein
MTLKRLAALALTLAGLTLTACVNLHTPAPIRVVHVYQVTPTAGGVARSTAATVVVDGIITPVATGATVRVASGAQINLDVTADYGSEAACFIFADGAWVIPGQHVTSTDTILVTAHCTWTAP